VEIDALGRVLIPDYLKQFAGLKEKVVVAGVYKRLEIWDEESWNNYKQRVEKQTDMLAEKLGELGVY
jgi:MraZ protein